MKKNRKKEKYTSGFLNFVKKIELKERTIVIQTKVAYGLHMDIILIG